LPLLLAKENALKSRPVSYTAPQLVVCEHLMNIHGRLQSKEIAFPECTTLEEESQEAEESKCGIKVSADNPPSE